MENFIIKYLEEMGIKEFSFIILLILVLYRVIKDFFPYYFSRKSKSEIKLKNAQESLKLYNYPEKKAFLNEILEAEYNSHFFKTKNLVHQRIIMLLKTHDLISRLGDGKQLSMFLVKDNKKKIIKFNKDLIISQVIILIIASFISWVGIIYFRSELISVEQYSFHYFVHFLLSIFSFLVFFIMVFMFSMSIDNALRACRVVKKNLVTMKKIYLRLIEIENEAYK